MNSVLENSYAWTGSFVEAFQKLTCDVASLIYASFVSLTSDNSDTDTSSGSVASSSASVASSSASESTVPTTIATPTVISDDKSSLNITQIYQDLGALFAFDDFQYLLLKIFVSILVTNIFLIYIAWYVYGTRITERFMSQNSSSEEINQAVSQLKLPREHCQRYA